MKLRLCTIALCTGLFASLAAAAQAPAGAPSGSTAQCNDGTYFSGATKSGACRGHKGIKTWWGAAATSKPSPATTKASAAASKAAVAPPSAPPATAPASKASGAPLKGVGQSANAAAGGGPGMVWVNTSTKVYHCYGDRYYGKTKNGKYMSEGDAKAMGAKPDAGKPCSK